MLHFGYASAGPRRTVPLKLLREVRRSSANVSERPARCSRSDPQPTLTLRPSPPYELENTKRARAADNGKAILSDLQSTNELVSKFGRLHWWRKTATHAQERQIPREQPLAQRNHGIAIKDVGKRIAIA